MKGVRIVSKPRPGTSDFRTSTVIDRSILNLISNSMSAGGYGPRQRSKWINEALLSLQFALSECSEQECVETLSRAVTLSENGAHTNLVLKPEVVRLIEYYRDLMGGYDLGFEDNAQSRLIHFAITYRLMREKLL
jgi:hypothetical protein